MSDRTFVDTNVLVYAFDESEPDKRETAHELLASSDLGEIVVSTQVLQELYVALTRGPDPIRSSAEAEDAVREASKLVVVQVDTALVLAAIVKSRQHMISFWDALIVQAAQAAGCARLMSEDLNDGQAMGTVRVENPFAAEKPSRERKPQAPKARRKRH